MARPFGSRIRQSIVEILGVMGSGYGYEIFKIYREVFPKATMRSIYYHLKRGAAIGEFKIERVEKVKGDYSWGSEVEKIIYSLGSSAKPKGDERVKAFFEAKWKGKTG